MSKSKFTGLVLGILFSASSFAQSNHCCGRTNENKGEVVMTRSELKDFLQTVADARRAKLEQVQKRNDEIELLKARVRYYKEKSQNLDATQGKKSCCSSEPKSEKRDDSSQEIALLNKKLDALVEAMKHSYSDNKPNVVDLRNSGSDDLRSQIAALEEQMKNANSSERKSMLDNLLKRYGNFRKHVFFANDSKTVTESDLNYIKDVAEVLRNHSELSVVLEGYASPVGSVLYNKNLSMERAEAVKQAIQRYGIAASRVLPAFKGEDHSNSEEYARRVDMTIVVK